MKWFEDLLDDTPGNSPSNIAENADAALDNETMDRFFRDIFYSQKRFSEFLGVGEPTVAGWVKNQSFPDYAKRATLAAYYAKKYHGELQRKEDEFNQPKVVQDGDKYLVVMHHKDITGVSIGRIIARDIPSEKHALVLASCTRAWRLLEDAEVLIDDEIEARDGESSEWILDLKEKISREKRLAFSHKEWLEILKKENEEIEALSREIPLPDLKALRDKKSAETAADYNTEAFGADEKDENNA